MGLTCCAVFPIEELRQGYNNRRHKLAQTTATVADIIHESITRMCKMPEVDSQWEFEVRCPHVTFTSLMDPILGQEFPPQPAQKQWVWQTAKQDIASAAASAGLTPFTIAFSRLKVDDTGKVIIEGAAEPRMTPAIQGVRQRVGYLFKGDRHRDNPLFWSVIGQIRHEEPDALIPLQWLQRELDRAADVDHRIDVDYLYLVEYRNRRVDPREDVRRIERLRLPPGQTAWEPIYPETRHADAERLLAG